MSAGCAATALPKSESPALTRGPTAAHAMPSDMPTALARWTATVSHHHALMLGMRVTEVWLWPEPFAETRPAVLRARYTEAFTTPPKWNNRASWFQWDGDRWFINVLGHAALGSELYLGARRCHFEPLAAVSLAAVGSVVWEYGYEASGVRPSALDLLYTPVAGIIVGETRHLLIKEAQKLRPGWKNFVTVLLDPFGEVERTFGFKC
jgi:hypothetical protein